MINLRQLNSGRNMLLQNVTSGIKTEIGEWRKFDPQLTKSKITRGFNHPDCGQLLCPAEYDWDKEEYVWLVGSHINADAVMNNAEYASPCATLIAGIPTARISCHALCGPQTRCLIQTTSCLTSIAAS